MQVCSVSLRHLENQINKRRLLVFPLGENRTDSTFLGWEISERSVTEKGPERGLSYFLGLMPSSGRGFLFCELYSCFFINMKHVVEKKRHLLCPAFFTLGSDHVTINLDKNTFSLLTSIIQIEVFVGILKVERV